jgi:Reverse transcriptase (RNA-dependent DNA polymerase)
MFSGSYELLNNISKKFDQTPRKEEVIELFREFFSDTVNFVHRQVLQISALHICLRKVLFEYCAVEKPVGGGYMPSCLIKVLVPDKEEYGILADVLREERAKNSRDSSMDDEDLQYRSSKETYRTQRTRTVDRDDKKLFLYHASAEEKSSAPSDAECDQQVEMEGLAQRAIGSEDIDHLLISRITEPPTVNGRENCSFLVAQHSGTAEYVPLRSILSDSNYKKGNAQDNAQDNVQDNVLGSTKKDDVPGNAKEDDDQDVKDENNSTSSLIAILPLMTRSTTQAAEDVSSVSIVHHVLTAKETTPSDAIYPQLRINAINKEVRGLINRRAFSLVHVDAVHSHANIIGTRNITRLKHFDTIYEEAKARLTIQGFQNAEKNRIVYNAPTVSHASIRILISFATIKVYPMWTKDTTHAFLQSKNTFLRDPYAMLPLELRSVFKGYVRHMLKPLYGTKEAGTYWNTAYSGDWKQKAGVTSFTLDPCFMTKPCNQGKGAPHRIAAILVDDTLMTRNKHFAKAEERIHSNYDIGQTQTITNGSQIKFGGVQIGRDPDGTLRIPQEAYIENLSNIKADLYNDIASVRTARGKVSWIATWTRPDAAFAMGRLSQITPENINSEATESCNDLNDYLKKTVKRNLIFCKLDVKSLHVVFYSDASFAGNLDLSSQIGGIILLKDKHGNAHVLHWFSKKCPCVTGSVIAAEIIGFVYCI